MDCIELFEMEGYGCSVKEISTDTRVLGTDSVIGIHWRCNLAL